MKSLRSASLLAILASAVPAQIGPVSPTLHLSTETAVGVFAKDGPLVDVQIVAAGTPIPVPFALNAQAGGGQASTRATPQSPTTNLGVHIHEDGSAVRNSALSDPSAGTTSSPAASTQLSSPHAFLMDLRGALQGKIVMHLTGDATSGARAWAAVDVGADGSIEFQQAVNGNAHRAEVGVSSPSGVPVIIAMFGFADTDPGRLGSGYRADLTVEFEPDMPCAITQYGQGCGPVLDGSDTLRGNVHVFDFKVSGAFPNAPVAMVFGDRPIAVRIPGTNCPLLAFPLVLVNLRADANGDAQLGIKVAGPMSGAAYLQALPFRLSAVGGLEITSSNGLKVDCDA